MTINKRFFVSAVISLILLTTSAGAEKFATPDYGPVTDASELLIRKPENAPAGQWSVAEQPPRITFSSVRGLQANPGHDDWLWTNFGEGFHGSNGKFYVAFGNNAAIDGNCCVYEYDPRTHQQQRVLDMAELLDQEPGEFGHGKLHGRLDEMPDGWVYMATYCSIKSPKISDARRARVGSRFVRYNILTEQAEDLGMPVLGDTYPMNGTDTRRGIFHGVGLRGGYIAYDIHSSTPRYQGRLPGDINWSQRVTLIDPRTGLCFGSDPQTSRIIKYDPQTSRFSTTNADIPRHPEQQTEAHPGIRTYTRRRLPDGSFIVQTSNGVMFKFWPDEEKTTYLGLNWADGGYCPAMALSPDSRYLYYTVGTHGDPLRSGPPLIRLDTRTLEKKVLAFLGPWSKQKHNYKLGTSYAINVDDTGRHLLITFNGRFFEKQPEKVNPYGQPAFMFVELP
jgi:hypothetical protein